MTCSEVGWIHKEAKFERGLWPLLCGAQWLDLCLEDSDTRPSGVEAKKLELTFVVMLDGRKQRKLLQGLGQGQDEGGEAPVQFLGPEEGSKSYWLQHCELWCWASCEPELWWADSENFQGLGKETKEGRVFCRKYQDDVFNCSVKYWKVCNSLMLLKTEWEVNS